MLLEMPPVFLRVGCVHDEQIVVLIEAIQIGVVDQASLFIRHQRVLRLPGLEGFRVVRQHVLQKRNLVRSLEPEPAHVADVEQSAELARCQMFLENAGLILHRHVPTAEINHFCAMRAVPRMQRRFLEIACRHGNISSIQKSLLG